MEFNLKQSYRSLLIINLALISGVMMFFLAILVIFDFQIPEFKSGFETINVVSVLIFGIIPVGVRVSAAMLKKIKDDSPLSDRFAQVQKALIVRWACIEGATLFSLVGLFLTEDSKQIAIFLLCLVMFFNYFLTKEKMVEMLKLEKDEARKFRANV